MVEWCCVGRVLRVIECLSSSPSSLGEFQLSGNRRGPEALRGWVRKTFGGKGTNAVCEDERNKERERKRAC